MREAERRASEKCARERRFRYLNGHNATYSTPADSHLHVANCRAPPCHAARLGNPRIVRARHAKTLIRSYVIRSTTDRSPTLPPHLTRRARSRSCNDKDISCASWSRDGLCDSDAVVKDLCPHSCGVCSLMCSDRDDSCAAWAKDGECTKSPDYMLKECPTSCGLCAPKCADISPDCNHWGKEGNCDSSASAAHTSAICTLSRCIVALFCTCVG